MLQILSFEMKEVVDAVILRGGCVQHSSLNRHHSDQNVMMLSFSQQEAGGVEVQDKWPFICKWNRYFHDVKGQNCHSYLIRNWSWLLHLLWTEQLIITNSIWNLKRKVDCLTKACELKLSMLLECISEENVPMFFPVLYLPPHQVTDRL
jgi:hypothetical protein